MNCPICNTNSIHFHSTKKHNYLHCSLCKCVFMHPGELPAFDAEKQRYEKHENNIYDKGYQKFVSPIVESVKKDFNSNQLGLDFGSGPGPVISKLLRDAGYSIATYDPIFDNNQKALTHQYDYIVCCEVIEHFHNPMKEFILLKKLLKPHGKLYCMTELFDENINFANWYYKDDFTHVIFYHKNTLSVIKEMLNFESIQYSERQIIFQKKSNH